MKVAIQVTIRIKGKTQSRGLVAQVVRLFVMLALNPVMYSVTAPIRTSRRDFIPMRRQLPVRTVVIPVMFRPTAPEDRHILYMEMGVLQLLRGPLTAISQDQNQPTFQP